jgi:hypothetical protein
MTTLKNKIKAFTVSFWAADRSKLIDWPDNKPRARSVCYPDKQVTFNDVFAGTDPNNTKGRQFSKYETL